MAAPSVSVATAQVPPPQAQRFRLEFAHDAAAREMRWVLFASGRRGAVGKLVFTLDRDNDGRSAHVKSLAVHREWRGLGLARVLYLACLATLAQQQHARVGELRLEAEEDTRRHGKLVALYRSWGFEEVPDAKVLFLYNQNDCFRKVPMSLAFKARDCFPALPRKDTWFCMITLTTSDGTCLVASEDGAIAARKDKCAEAMWQTLLGPDGEIYLRSAHGKFLCVEDSGTVLADRPWNSTWETFQVVPFHDLASASTGTSAASNAIEHSSGNASVSTQVIVCTVDESELKNEVGSGSTTPEHATSATTTVAAVTATMTITGSGVALKDYHGSYLCIDEAKQQVVSSRVPVPWDGGGEITALVCNKADLTPLYAKLMRKYQNSTFVQQQTAKFGAFKHATMSIAEAYEALMVLTGDGDAPAGSWLLHHVLATAEAAREDGHPDWLQLALFLRGLGMIFLLWADDDIAMLRSISASEWMLLVSTWVVGEPIPDKIPFPHLNALNSDHVAGTAKQALESVDATRSGMDSVTLPWTPDEYLFRVLEFNKTSLPVEALQAIRFWSLRLWYQSDCYEHLTTPQDVETKDWLRMVTCYASVPKEKMKAVAPESRMPYYLGLASKYVPEKLQW